MKGSETQLLGLMEGADKRYVIPVYQRKYDWKVDNCRQLYVYFKKVIRDGKGHHFFGSKIEYHIIDGRQRLAAVMLLLLAIFNMIRSGKMKSADGTIVDLIMNVTESSRKALAVALRLIFLRRPASVRGMAIEALLIGNIFKLIGRYLRLGNVIF